MIRRLLLLSSFLLLVSAAGAASPGPWPDFPPEAQTDPSLHAGRLPNGLRYFVYQNDSPKDHIVMRLVVAAGSRNEHPGQFGVAHLVEHMAFRSARGSEYSALMKQLERLGVGLGPNNNAYTYYDTTQYFLDLPKKDPAYLLTGLKLFRAFASDTHFDPTAVETEKQVVLSEERLHQVEGDNSAFEYYGFLWPQVSSVRRPVGGSALSISGLSASDCASFYADWYRPDRMAVIVVGPVDPDVTIQALRETLGGFSDKTRFAPPIPNAKPAIETPLDKVRFDVVPLNAVNEVNLTLSQSWIEKPTPFTHEREMQDLRLGLGLVMFQQRMRELSLRPGFSFNALTLQPLNPYPSLGLRGVQLSVVTSPTSWKETLGSTVTELRRAQLFGFTKFEFELAKEMFLNGYREAVRYWPTRQSIQIVDGLVYSLQSGQPMFTAQASHDRMKALLEKVTLADCDAAFSDAWKGSRLPNVYLAAPPSVTLRSRVITQVLDEAKAAHITPPKPQSGPTSFAYETFGTPGKLTAEQHLGDLDVWLDRFDNGVRFNFKHTDFQSDVVDAYIRVGTGRLSLPSDKPGLALAAQAALLVGGLRRQSNRAIAEITATHTIWINFYVMDDALLFQLRAARNDFPLALKLATAFIQDPALHASVMPQVRVYLNQVYDKSVGTPNGELSLDEERILAGGDPRFGLGKRSDALRRTMSEIRSWLRPQLASGPIEMSVVGDISYNDARSLVSSTLGALPKRHERPAHIDDGIHSYASPNVYVLEGVGLSIQDGLSYVWMTPWVTTMEQDRRLRLMAEVINQRLRSRLRDTLGISYVTDAQYISHSGFDHFSYVQFYTQVSPQLLQNSVAAIERELGDLAANGVGRDEFERARNPWLNFYDTSLRQNSYWGATVLDDAQLHPANIAAARNRTADTHAISRKEINALLGQVLDPGNTLHFIVQLKPPDLIVTRDFTTP